MPSLTNHQSNSFVKLLLTGDSGSGKSGALASLVGAGYKLRILDMDNGLDPLKTYVEHDCPHLLGNVEFRTLRDGYKTTAAGPVVDRPRAFVDAMKMLDHWKYDDTDLGKPALWGPDYILVVDSLTFLSDAAYDWAEPLTPVGKSGERDNRAVYGNAQGAIESALALLTSSSFATNVIVTAHIRYMTGDDGSIKGYPTAIGQALGPTIPRYFNQWAQCRNRAGKRTIETAATTMFDLKNTKPFTMGKSYDLGDGLAKFFAVLRDPPQQEAPAKPKILTLKRV